MVLPTTELSSTLNPFTVLTTEDGEGSERRRGSRGGASSGENENHGKFFDGNNNKSTKSNTLCAPPSAHRRNRQPAASVAVLPHQTGCSTLNRTSRVQSLSPPPPIIPIEQLIEQNEREKRSNSSDNALNQNRISGTTTLDEGHANENEIEKRLAAAANELSHYPSQNNQQSYCDDDGSSSSNKILNLLNARNSSNSSLLSNASSDKSCNTNKLSEDQLFSDLKSRFLEKHFRTILRSQQSKESRIFGGGGASNNTFSNSNNVDTLPLSSAKSPKIGKDGATKDSSAGGVVGSCSTLLKSLRFVTVERPEPTLDAPRQSYFKSTKQKFLKMHDQAKLRVAERYRKLCVGLRTTIWPQLYPLQVLVEILLSNVFMLFVAPFVLCGVMLLCIVRFCVGAVLKIRYKGRYQLMSGSDAAWAYQSFANDSSFLSLYVIQGDCNIRTIRERIMKSVINCQDPQYPGKFTYSRLKCRITEKFGFYCWESLHPMDFCIDDHVRYITNDPSAVLTQEQVLREIQKFIDQPLPEDQPQWQILVVPKFLYNRDNYPVNDDLEDDGFGNFDTITVKKKPTSYNNNFYTGNHYYALVWRINHAIMDGISASNCLQHCIADMPVKLTIDPLQTVSLPVGVRLVMYLKMLVFGSRSLLQSMLHRDLNCFHGPGLTGPKNLAWSRSINLQTVKTIKKKNDGATVTAVMASAVGSALRGLALRKNNPVPVEIRAGVTCALLPYPNIQPQNRFTVAHLKLELDPDSPKDRLVSATKAAQELVRSADIWKNYGLIRMIGLGPKKAIPWFMDNCEATVLISNIPGPMEEYTIFQGQKLVDIIGWNTIKGNTAIGVCLFSYAGRIRAGVIADGAVLPSSTDVPGLIDELEKDIVNMAKDADLKEKDVFIDAL